MKSPVIAIIACLIIGMVPALLFAQSEVEFAKQDFNKLDTFEAHSLEKADKIFHDKEYKRAAAEYDAFSLEFSKSSALPYALLRKGRCLHLDNKRYEAIKAYTEVLDYFPNSIAYAAAALYYTGVCQWENGDQDKAMKSWAEMADDEDYSKTPLAAYAINRLADYLAEHEQQSKAINYYWQVAVDFRDQNPAAAWQAMDKVIAYYVRTKPDEAKLREFYTKVQGFDRRPLRDVPEKLEEDGTYWNKIRGYVRQYGQFNDVQAPQRRDYYAKWAKAMDGRFAKWDDYQIDLASFYLLSNDDRDAWAKRLDQQYEKYQGDADYNRTIKWMGIFASNRDKVKDYYAKLDFEKMDNAAIINVLRFFYDGMPDRELAHNVFGKLRLDKMNDDGKKNLARWLWQKDEQLVIDLCQSMSDTELGKVEQLRYYHWRRNVGKAMPLADDLINNPDYAKEATWKKAEMLQWSKKYQDAIKFYQQADNPPSNLYRVSECYASLGQPDQAIGTLKEIENFFKDNAPDAALRIAYIYRDSGKRDRYVASLRSVLAKYPKSSQSSQAHEQLEALGERITGGVNAEQ